MSTTSIVQVVAVTRKVVGVAAEQSETAVYTGVFGLRGEPGDAGSGGDGLYIQDTQPTAPGRWLWVDTTGGDTQLWYEDGTP